MNAPGGRRKIFRTGVGLGGFLGGLLWLAWAGSAAESDSAPVVELQSVEVHAKSTKNPVEEPLDTLPSQELSTSTITRDEIELTRPRLAVDALEFTPSFQVKRKGRKNPVGLSIRGGENVNVLFDGMLVGTKEDTRFIDFLPASVIQEIRVIRDSTGLIYGPPQLAGSGGAMGFGGVIDIRLLDPPEGHHGELRLDIGRFDENTQHLHLAGFATKDLGYVFSVDHDGYDGPGGENMGHRFLHGLARFIYHYGDGSTITFNAFHTDGMRELQKAGPGSVFTGRKEEYDPWKTSIYTLKLNHVWNDGCSSTVETYYRRYEATYIRHEIGTEDDLEETKKGIALRQTVTFPENNTLRLGGEASNWDNPSGKLYYIGTSREEQAYSWYVQDDWEVLPDKLTLDAGVRWDRTYLVDGVIANGPGFVGGKPVIVHDVWEDPSVSWSVGAAWHVTEKQTATLRYAVSTQSASGDVVGAGGTSVEDPEERRVELGYRIEASRHAIFTVTGFWTNMDNGLIYAGPINVGGTLHPSWKNADFKRLGVEVQAEGEIREGLSYFANATWIHATTDSSTTDETHDDKVPRLYFASGLRWERGPWRGAVSLKYTDGYQDTFATRPLQAVDCGDYWLMDMNLAYVLATGATFEHEIYAGARNALNEHFNTYPAYDDPGRSLYIGYALHW